MWAVCLPAAHAWSSSRAASVPCCAPSSFRTCSHGEATCGMKGMHGERIEPQCTTAHCTSFPGEADAHLGV